MKSNNSLNHFDQFIIRTPLLPINYFFELTEKETIENKKLFQAFENAIIKEAIYIASPDLYYSINKWIKGDLTNNKKIDRIKLSFSKYLIRMSTRCTPFGLFAGLSVGEFSTNTKTIRNELTNSKKFSRIDHEALYKLTKVLSLNEDIKKHLKYFCNSSIYHLEDSIRYVETIWDKSIRDHKVVSIEKTNLLSMVLELVEDGITFKDIISHFTKLEVNTALITNYINNLINNQVLVSELEPNTIGIEYLDRIISVLERFNNNSVSNIKLLKERLYNLNSKLGSGKEFYQEINKILTDYDLSLSNKNSIKTDLYVNFCNNELDNKAFKNITKGVAFLNKLDLDKKGDVIDDFKKAFEKRYGERKVSLNYVLDPEMGIGYLQDYKENPITGLIDQIDFPFNKKRFQLKQTLKRGDILLLEKMTNLNKGHTIELNDKDIDQTDMEWNNYSTDWSSIHETNSILAELIIEKGENKYLLHGCYGPTALTFISRFTTNEDVNLLCNKIAAHEQEIADQKGYIIAEMSYFPKKNAGGVNIKKDNRDYEIPYLTFSDKEKDKQISLNDLLIFIENGKIKIWSKTFNKEVKPKVSDAHFYEYGSLPIYHFLNEIQLQGKRINTSFYLNQYIIKSNFIPRIEYKNIILSLARWRFKVTDFEYILEEKNNNEMMRKLHLWLRENKIPLIAKLAGANSELVINFKNITSVQILFSIIKKQYDFVLTEFLFSPKHGVVKDKDGVYANEIIIPCYKSEK